jgi:hypothetical protein
MAMERKCEHKSDKHESGTGFYTSRQNKDDRVDFEPVNERTCKIMVKLQY